MIVPGALLRIGGIMMFFGGSADDSRSRVPHQPHAPRGFAPPSRIRPKRRSLTRIILHFSLLTVCAILCAGALLFVVFESTTERYDPQLFAIGVSGLFAGACVIAALLLARLRFLRARLRKLQARLEDITDQNWELKETVERARSFLDAQDDAIVRRDATGTVTYANDAYCALAGRPRETIIGHNAPLVIVTAGDASDAADGSRQHDQLIATPQGERWIAWRDVAVLLAGSDAGEMQSVGRDVTARKETERALGAARDQAHAASEAKSRFLAMVSHEVRTPLNGILGMADLLTDTALTQEQTTYVKAVKTSGENLLALIEDILDFSKIEAGRLDLYARPFSVRALIEDIVELLAPRAQAKSLGMASFVDDGVAQTVSGDATRLRQVLLNLAGNALKFTQTGGIALIVEPGACNSDITFTVQDTGIGIPSAQHERIFEEFEQAETGESRRFGGTGLGLAISKRIVAHMGGRITLTSTPGEGSRFAVTLPFAQDMHSGAQTDAPSFVPPDLAQAMVMVVAPDSIETALLIRRLQVWGAQTCVATDIATATALLPERDWHAVLVDHTLGLADAAAVLHAAIGVDRRLVMIPTGARETRTALLQAGATGYLLKPLRAASLAARLQNPEAWPASSAHDGQPSVTVADAVLADDSRAAMRAASPTRGGLAVLVVEDNDINALLTRALLAKLGHRPTIARDGEAGVESWMAAAVAGTPYDLVLMDLHMPGVDGSECARRIRQAEVRTGTGRTPIVALTADALAQNRERGGPDADPAGGLMDAFLTKPIDRERLTEVVTFIDRRAGADNGGQMATSRHVLAAGQVSATVRTPLS